MRKPNPYKQSLKLLEDLYKEYPTFTIGRHISTALADYGNFWGLSDKEFHFALEKYQLELAYDNMSIDDSYVNKIVQDAQDLDSIFNDEQEEDDDGRY